MKQFSTELKLAVPMEVWVLEETVYISLDIKNKEQRTLGVIHIPGRC